MSAPDPPPTLAQGHDGDVLRWLQLVYREVAGVQMEMRERLQALTQTVLLLTGKVDRVMALVDDLKTAIAQLDQETTAIGTLVTSLAARLQHGNLSASEQAEVFAALTAVGQRLTTLAVDPTNPVPPDTPPLVAARKLAGVKHP